MYLFFDLNVCHFQFLYCNGLLLLFFFIENRNMAAYEIREAYQSSTNGSYVAYLGCDGDMDTFSLTNYGNKESWSVLLDKIYKITWIFVRIRAGKCFFSENRFMRNDLNPFRLDNFEESSLLCLTK